MPGVRSVKVEHTEKNYWTPERMKAAIPLPIPGREGEHQAGGPLAPRTLSTGDPVPNPTASPFCLVGCLFFKKPNDPSQWLGTGFLINTNTVLTAAHNLMKFGAYNQNIMWVPALAGLYAPLGTYQLGKTMAFPDTWSNTDNPAAYDYAILEIAPNSDGKDAGDVIGQTALIAQTDPTFGQTLLAEVGYDSNQSMLVDAGDALRLEDRGGGKMLVKVGALPGGGSGGPWFIANGGNISNVVNGLTAEGKDDLEYSPHFDQDFLDWLVTAEKDIHS